jgi:membrane protein required for colicin V production
MSALSYAASRLMRKNNLSAVDRSLGFLFGLLRGGLLVCLLYICVTFVFPLPKQGEEIDPNTMQAVLMEARTQPVLAAGARFLESFAPDSGISLEDITSNPLTELVQPKLERREDPTPNAQQGYGEPARNNLSSIIDRVSGDEASQPEELPPEER